MNDIKIVRRSDASSELTIGVAFDNARIAAGLIDEYGRVVAVRQAEPPTHTIRSTAATMTRLILDVASAHERLNSSIRTIGLSIPGNVDPSTERTTIPGLKSWTRVALRRMIEEGLNESGQDIRTPTNEKRARAQPGVSPHPVIKIHSRAVCRAAAESRRGAARGKVHVIYLHLAKELEVGILAEGRALTGVGGYAGAANWLCLTESFKPEYAARGSLATEIGEASLVRRALEEWSGSSNSMLGKVIKADPAGLTPATIIRAAQGGDKLAIKVIDQTCRWIGRAAANLISLVNPEAVVIGGGFGLSLRPFLDQIREESRLWAAPEAGRQCRIVNATLGNEAEMIGSAQLARL